MVRGPRLNRRPLFSRLVLLFLVLLLLVSLFQSLLSFLRTEDDGNDILAVILVCNAGTANQRPGQEHRINSGSEPYAVRYFVHLARDINRNRHKRQHGVGECEVADSGALPRNEPHHIAEQAQAPDAGGVDHDSLNHILPVA